MIVVTARPKPAGRGNELRPTPVAEAARALRVPVAEVETVKVGRGFKRLAVTAPDVLAVVAYGEILPPNVLNLPGIAPLNLHFSLLPLLRGASPVQTALLIGAEETGITTIVMDHGLDTGPILMQRTERILAEDDAESLGDRLAMLGARVLVETADALAEGPKSPVPQDDSLATHAPKFTAEDRILDWSNPARVLVNLVRALSPEPAATTTFRGEGLKVFSAQALPGDGEPGTIVAVTHEGFMIGTAEGGFAPIEVAPAGRKRMNAVAFVNGYRPEPGERVG